MKEKNNFLIVLGISLLLAFVVFFYTKYSNQELINTDMFGIQQTNIQPVESSVDESKKVEINQVEEVFVKLIQSYNEQNLDLLEKVDFRYLNNRNNIKGIEYVDAIKKCNNFVLHKVFINSYTTKSIKGYIIYSYNIKGSDEQRYVLSSYTVQSYQGEFVITYLNTEDSNEEKIKEYLNN